MTDALQPLPTRRAVKASPDSPSTSDLNANAERRPRPGARKAHAVLEAAERILLRDGYAATSMDDVANEAQVSKRTVYSNFGSKAQLFAEVVQERCAKILPTPDLIEQAEMLGPAEGLRLLVCAFLTGIFNPGQVELSQTVIATARSHPDIGGVMYEGPILASQQMFAQYLKSRIERGELALKDADLAAIQLMALVKSDIHMKLLLGRDVPINAEVIAKSAAASVELFLNGARPR